MRPARAVARGDQRRRLIRTDWSVAQRLSQYTPSSAEHSHANCRALPYRNSLKINDVRVPSARQSVDTAPSTPLIPRHAPVAVLPDLQGLTAGVADLDHVAWHREVEEPRGVVTIEVQAAVAGVGVALRPHRRVELMQ